MAPSPRCSRVVRTLGVLLFLEDLLAADDHVAALLVELDDADFNLLAEIAVEIADGTNLKLRAGQKGLHADVDGEAALDAADDGAHDRGLVVGGLLNGVPHAEALGLLVADEIAAFGLFALDDHVDHFAGLELDCAGVIDNLLDRHEALGLEAYVDDEVLFSLLEDGAGDDFVAIGFDGGSFSGLLALKGFEGSGEIISGFGTVFGRRGRNVSDGFCKFRVLLLCGNGLGYRLGWGIGVQRG